MMEPHDTGSHAGPLNVNLLRVIYRVTAPITLPEYRGPMLRGAIFDAMRARFCLQLDQPEAQCGAVSGCQVCGFVAPRNAAGERGIEVPRPYAIRPTINSGFELRPDDTLSFDLALFGSGIRYVPHLVLALQSVRNIGAGRATQSAPQLALHAIWNVNDFTGEAHRVAGAHQLGIEMPRLPVGQSHILARACAMPAGPLTIQLRTPLRLTAQQDLVHHITFAVFLRRIINRLQSLTTNYGNAPIDGDLAPLLACADGVKTIRDNTRWQDVASHSSRLQRATPIGGLVGSITFGGDLAAFLPWLLWGELVQIGKDTSKGNGWYGIQTG